jgi:hypothetical protein
VSHGLAGGEMKRELTSSKCLLTVPRRDFLLNTAASAMTFLVIKTTPTSSRLTLILGYVVVYYLIVLNASFLLAYSL